MPVHPNYSNGRVPASALTVVQTGLFMGRRYSISLYTPVANAWRGLKARVAQAGIAAYLAPPAGGYRSLATQVDMHTNPGLYGLNPNSGAALALVGYSTHGWGTALDIMPQAALNLVLANAQRIAHQFGFYKSIANDPNHLDRLDLTTASTGSITSIDNDGGASPAPIPKKDKIMDHWWLTDSNGPLYTLVNHARREFCQTRDAGRATLWAVLYGNAVQINSAGNLTYGLQGYKSVAYPFVPDPAPSVAPIDQAALDAAVSAAVAKIKIPSAADIAAEIGNRINNG